MLLGADSAPPPPTPEAVALIAQLARPAPADTAYAEVRFVNVLRRPLLLRGSLHFGGGGELGKNVDEPYRETTTIANGQVDVQRAGKPAQHFALERAPELQVLLAAFSALLAGDAAALTKTYAIDAKSSGADFTLTLTPRGGALARHLRAFVVDASGNEPRCFSLRQADGDASVMLLGSLAVMPLDDAPSATALASLCHHVAQ